MSDDPFAPPQDDPSEAMEPLPAADPRLEFQYAAVRPIECFREGWSLIADQYWLFFGLCLVGVIIASAVPLGILMGPMMCGMYICFFDRMRGRPVDFARLFRGFDHFKESLIVTLIMVAVSLVFLLPMTCLLALLPAGIAAAAEGGNDLLVGGLVALTVAAYVFVILASYLISICFIFAYPLIVDRGLTAGAAMKSSFAAVRMNLWGIIGLGLINLVLNLAASLLCIFPAYLLIPVHLAAFAVAYRKVFPDLGELKPEKQFAAQSPE